ncbi:MAG: T9SS type A sorting domain-containing protein [Saprospiraceae bacterium]
MKSNFQLLVAAISLLLSTAAFGQSGLVSSGGNGTGAGGKISFSIGQVLDQSSNSATKSISEGVQQPFEIQISTGVKLGNLPFEVSVFPNPSSSEIQILRSSDQYQSAQASFYDLSGHLLLQQEMTESTTKINLQPFPAGIYTLRISLKYYGEQTFQVVKQ